MLPRSQSTLLVLFFASFSLTQAATEEMPAPEAPQWLIGEYGVVINQTCVRTPYQEPPAQGFDPETKALLAEGEPLTALGKGRLRFHPNGTLELLEGVQTEAPFLDTAVGKTPIVPPVYFSCTGEYELSGRHVSLSMNYNIDSGDPALTITLGPQGFEGDISVDRRTISLTNITGGIQTITISVNEFYPVQERQRICTQHALAIR